MFDDLKEYEIYYETYINLLVPLFLVIQLDSYIEQADIDPLKVVRIEYIQSRILNEELDVDRINAQGLMYYGDKIIEDDAVTDLFNLSKKGLVDPDLLNFEYASTSVEAYKGKNYVSLLTEELAERLQQDVRNRMVALYVRRLNLLKELEEAFYVSTDE